MYEQQVIQIIYQGRSKKGGGAAYLVDFKVYPQEFRDQGEYLR